MSMSGKYEIGIRNGNIFRIVRRMRQQNDKIIG